MASPKVQNKEAEVTPEMIEAGERAIFAFGVEPLLSTAGWSASLAERVYRAMVLAGSTTRAQSQSCNRAK